MHFIVWKAEVEMVLGNQKLSHEVLFADIKNDGILGIDFLSTHRSDVLLSKNYFLSNGEKIVCFRSCEDASAMCCRVAITERVQILPECEMIVKGRPIDNLTKTV